MLRERHFVDRLLMIVNNWSNYQGEKEINFTALNRDLIDYLEVVFETLNSVGTISIHMNNGAVQPPSHRGTMTLNSTIIHN